MIQDSLKNKKHVIEYCKIGMNNNNNYEEIIPTQQQVVEILKVGYSLASSKQNAFPYKVAVLGTDYKRSEHLQKLCEGRKIDKDGELPPGATYIPNPNLYHLGTAAWTLIITPRMAAPNKYQEMQLDKHGSHWEYDTVEKQESCKEAFAVEVGILATTITGAAMDQGWNCAYNVCFPYQIEKYKDFPYIDYKPYLIITLGKALKFKKDVFKPESLAADTRPGFDEIFTLVDKDKK
tara:strand:+ start:33 stop:737 length:705 start_codon:yes stop_codon:yes gene_type:complete